MKLDRNKIKERIIKIALEKHYDHVGSALSCVDVLCSVYESKPPKIVILSKGHASLAQYVILNEVGKLPDRYLAKFNVNGGLGEHIKLNQKYGVFASTGSLGHGLPIGIGYAIANPRKIVFVILGDGELDEGSNLEALRIIKKLKITNILPIVDYNGWQGFSQFNGDIPEGCRVYYSTKGQGLGDYEDKLSSHYVRLNQELVDNFIKGLK